MFLLILDSLGTTELLFILAVALIFFGPRKLPQISRQIGKSLAEFRRASEDFKRTWEREVALESTADLEVDRTVPPQDNSVLNPTIERGKPLSDEATETSALETTGRQLPSSAAEPFGASDSPAAATDSEPTRKRDWL